MSQLEAYLHPVFDHIQRNRDAYLERLTDYLRMPSISTQGIGMQAVADHLLAWLTRLELRAELLPVASAKVSSTQVSAGIGSPAGGVSADLGGNGVIADIACVVIVPSSREISQAMSRGPSSGGRCDRIRWPVRHQMMALAIEVLPEPFTPSISVTGLRGSNTNEAGGAFGEP